MPPKPKKKLNAGTRRNQQKQAANAKGEEFSMNNDVYLENKNGNKKKGKKGNGEMKLTPEGQKSHAEKHTKLKSSDAVASGKDRNFENDKENELSDFDIIPAVYSYSNSPSKSKKNDNEDSFEDIGESEEDKPADKSDCDSDGQVSPSSNTTKQPLEMNRNPNAEALLADRLRDLHSSSDNAALESNKSDKEESFEEIDEKTE